MLFYTDGITESRSPDGAFFGRERLADFLVRAALDGVPVAETARRLSASVIDYVDAGLRDDATLLLIEYRGQDPQLPDGGATDEPLERPDGAVEARGVSTSINVGRRSIVAGVISVLLPRCSPWGSNPQPMD